MKIVRIVLLALTFALITMTYAAAQSGNALDFNGSTDYVEVPYDAALNPSEFTIEAWARVEGGNGYFRSVITSRNGSPESGFIIYATSGNFWSFWTGNGSPWYNLNGPAITLNAWTHVAATYSAGTMEFFINGSSVGTLPAPNFAVNPNRPLRIGAGVTENPINYFFNGQIDEVRVWNVARTEAQIQSTMNTGIIGSLPDLAANWNFDNINGGMVPDVSGNGHMGTIFGAPVQTPSGAGITASVTVPTVSEWAMIVLTLSMLIGATIMIRRRSSVFASA